MTPNPVFISENSTASKALAIMNKKKINEKEIGNLSFEDALEELENITESFEDGDSTLENAVNLYNKGVLLKKHCEKKLKEAMRKEKRRTILWKTYK